jgi:hypothetical protein
MNLLKVSYGLVSTENKCVTSTSDVRTSDILRPALRRIVNMVRLSVGLRPGLPTGLHLCFQGVYEGLEPVMAKFQAEMVDGMIGKER